MGIQILEIKKESWPAARLIGRKYEGEANWGEWWENGWFEVLESAEPLSLNGDAYIGAIHVVNEQPERWIGMFFSESAAVPAGFESIAIEPLDYAVCYLRDKEGSGDFYTLETHRRCLEELGSLGFRRKEDSWGFERYQGPRFTSPDKEGQVILDYGIAVES